MKVFELFKSASEEISENVIVEKLKNFDWKYEFSDDISRITWGLREMQLIENLIYKFYKSNPEKAVALWNNNSPEAPSDKSVIPSFIVRLEALDK